MAKTKSVQARCAWVGENALMQHYHDTEWGVPEYDSRALWEKLMLDGFQAGLSWSTILNKREAFRKAFRGFEPAVVARFTERDVNRLMSDAGIVRSRAKIEATIGNAHAYLAMENAGENFSKFVWAFVAGTPQKSRRPRGAPIPAKTEVSEKLSAALKTRGFKFVGPVIVYAWMQATGLVDDHAYDCFRRSRIVA